MTEAAPARPRAADRSVLIVTDIVPGHRAAGEVRLVRMAALVAEQDRVALVALDRHLDDPDHRRIEQLAERGVEVVDGRRPTALRAALVARPYDLVVLEFWHVAERSLPLVRARLPEAVVVVDSVDLHFLRDQRAALLGAADPAGMQERKRRELAVYQAADARIFASQAELDLYTATTGISDGNLVVSIIVDPIDRPARPRPPVVVFVGNFWHAPNPDGVRWFAEQVWPAVRAARPDATFAVAGSRIGPDVQCLDELEGIEILGFVDDLHALYDRASVVVAPLRFGAGVKGKVVEALAAGVPVVATTLATEGLGLLDGVDLLVADEADRFAARVLQLLGDPTAAESLGARGRAAVEGRCGPAAAGAVLRALVGRARGVDGRGRRRWWLRTLPDRAWVAIRPVLASATRAARRRFSRRAP